MRKRGLILLQSILAFWLGTFLLLFPRSTFRSVVIVVGLYLILDGGMTLLEKAGEKSKLSTGLGAIAVLVGILALTNPRIFHFPLIAILAVWALIHGLISLADLVTSRQSKQVALWLGFTGIVLLTLALWMFGHISSSTLFIMRWVGIFGVIYGYALLGLSFAHKRAHETQQVAEARVPESKRVA